MKILTESELKKYLQLQVEKLGILRLSTKQENTPVQEFENSKKETISESDSVQIEDVKLLAEEVKRMKELIDFRSPLMKKD